MRTMAPVSLSSEAELPTWLWSIIDGFRKVDFGDVDALKAVINENTAAVFVNQFKVKRV